MGRKELQYSFRGCYTTNGRLKALNRRAEGRLLMAEKMAAVAAMHHAVPYPRTEIDRAWDHLLTNHFHDVICGTCTKEAMAEALFRYGEALEMAERVRHFAAKRRLDDERAAVKIEVLQRLLGSYADRLSDQFVVVTETKVRVSHR